MKEEASAEDITPTDNSYSTDEDGHPTRVVTSVPHKDLEKRAIGLHTKTGHPGKLDLDPAH